MIDSNNEKYSQPLPQAREPARKICEYLLAAGVCDEMAVMNGLERQENLRAKGYDPLIGMLLLDAGAITKKDLAQALNQGMTGKIVDIIDEEEGQRVEIFVE